MDEGAPGVVALEVAPVEDVLRTDRSDVLRHLQVVIARFRRKAGQRGGLERNANGTGIGLLGLQGRIAAHDGSEWAVPTLISVADDRSCRSTLPRQPQRAPLPER